LKSWSATASALSP